MNIFQYAGLKHKSFHGHFFLDHSQGSLHQRGVQTIFEVSPNVPRTHLGSVLFSF